MQQVLQDLSSGLVETAQVPSPALRAGHVLVQTSVSLVSAGTERMLTRFAKANLLQKALQQPDRVRQVFDNVRTNGLLETIAAVRSKLDQPIPLGYSNVGTVTAVGPGVAHLKPGDRVVSNGPHAEFVCVPTNLCARVPDGVGDEAAAFTVIGAIALQGIRLIAPTLGERVVVIGLGLIGLLAVQILKANGCRVLGMDVDARRVALAKSLNVEAVHIAPGDDAVGAGRQFSNNAGIDAVLIAASTNSSEPIAQAAKMCRQRGRIVLVGVTGTELDRVDFYEKELTFQVSCSYGPGRYDPDYEQRGRDYPPGFVRWTEQRNFEAVLELLSSGGIDTRPLISHRFNIAQASDGYDVLADDGNALGILVTYPVSRANSETTPQIVRLVSSGIEPQRKAAKTVVGVIGAGNYASRVLLPALRQQNVTIKTLVTQSGVNAVIHGRKSGAEIAATDVDAIFRDAAINTVVVATRHDSHAGLALRALGAGKNVFVEKPLALSHDDLNSIDALLKAPGPAKPILMVGFNRRFAPLVTQMKSLLSRSSEPKAIIATINAGSLPAAHWASDLETGGGRIAGEACHFIDLLRFLADAPISRVTTSLLGTGRSTVDDVATINLEFEDGSRGTVHYFSNGSKQFPKERFEVFVGGRVLQLDNFRVLKGYGWTGFSRAASWRQDKGHSACLAQFVEAVSTGAPSPIPLDQVMEVSRASLHAAGMQ